MAYDLKLAERIRIELEGLPYFEKKMFAGISFLFNENMACGVPGPDLLLRVDPEKHEKLLTHKYAKPLAMSGKPMKGWLMAEPDECKTSKSLDAWVKEGIKYALTLPSK